MRRTVILVPYRPDGAERQRSWEFCREVWAELGYPIVMGDRRGEFSRAAARNAAARAAGDWDAAVIVDADMLPGDRGQIEEAISLAREGAFVACYDVMHYLTEAGTEQALAGAPLERCETDNMPVALTWESAIAVSRGLWDAVGGYDERFVGWGYQGLAFMAACSRVAEKERVAGPLYHFAHPGTWGGKDERHLAENRRLYEEEYA